MTRARELSDSVRSHVTDHLKLKDVHSTMDKRLVMHVMNKTKEFSSQAHICYKFYEDLLSLVKGDARSSMACPKEWTSGAPTPSAPTSSSSSGAAIAELSSRGRSEKDVMDALSRIGCEIGSQCTCAETRLLYKVTDISVKAVTLKGVGDEKKYKQYKLTVPTEEFHMKFTKIKTDCDEMDRGV